MRKTIVFTAALIVASVNAQAADRYVADKTTRAECGACHMAYPPILLPAASWDAIMGDLSNHFGEDASLDEATTAAIRDYLVTAADRRSRSVNGADGKPIRRITKMRWFVSEHGWELSTRAKAKAGTMSNCGACHRGIDRGVIEDD